MAPNEYVSDLCKCLEKIQTDVAVRLSADFAKRKHALEKHGNDWIPSPGDSVLVRKPPTQAKRDSGAAPETAEEEKGVSRRLQPLTYPRAYRVKKLVGSKSYVLEDADTGSTELPFSQPVALSRLVPLELSQLEAPVNPDQDLWIDVKSNLHGRENTWLCRKITAQQATGAVRLTSMDGTKTEVVDLAEYEWKCRAAPTTSG